MDGEDGMVDVSRGWYEEMLEAWTIGVDGDGVAGSEGAVVSLCLGFRGMGFLRGARWWEGGGSAFVRFIRMCEVYWRLSWVRCRGLGMWRE